MAGPHFAPLPSTCLVDEAIPIRVEGLSAGDRVTLWLANRTLDDRIWAASATFVARDGAIDPARDAPFSGSYGGVDGMGLFWSRAATPLAALPMGVEVANDPVSVALTAQINGAAWLPAQRIDRSFTAPGIATHDVGEEGLVGKLFLPSGRRSSPGVIVLGGSDGGLGWSREVAGLLASRGFAALALAYFGVEPLPPTLDRIPLEYFGKAIQWFKSQPGVTSGRMGLCGISRGAELALLTAASYGEVNAVVAYVPSGVVWCGVPPIGHSAWSRNGVDVPFAEGPMGAEWQAALADGRARDDTDWYRLAGPDALAAAEIPVENIQGPLLLLSAEDDRLWPCSEFAQQVVRRCREHDFPHDVLHVAYPGAGHGLRWPHASATVSRFTHAVTGEMMDFGGSPQATAAARVDAWRQTLAFLRQHLAADEAPA